MPRLYGISRMIARSNYFAPLVPPTYTDPDAPPGYVTLMESSGGLYPASITWGGYNTYMSHGGTYFPGLPHACRRSVSLAKLRLEIKNTDHDRRGDDFPETRRRSEVAFLDDTIPRGSSFWMAVSVKPLTYPKPASMAETALMSGTLLQVKGADGGSSNSPSISVRRTNVDGVGVTTVGGAQTGQGVNRYSGTWATDVVHDIVMQFTLDEVAGAVKIWIDGSLVVDASGIPTAPDITGPDAYIKIGCYHSGGVGSDPDSSVSSEFGNLVLPQAASLLFRVSSPPAWPS